MWVTFLWHVPALLDLFWAVFGACRFGGAMPRIFQRSGCHGLQLKTLVTGGQVEESDGQIGLHIYIMNLT